MANTVEATAVWESVRNKPTLMVINSNYYY